MWGQPLTRPASDVAGHRSTVLVHLAGRSTLPGPQVVTAEVMATACPELSVERWARVLDGMCQPGMPRMVDDAQVPGARLLHPVGDGYALAPAGWAAAQRLTVGGAA